MNVYGSVEVFLDAFLQVIWPPGMVTPDQQSQSDADEEQHSDSEQVPESSNVSAGNYCFYCCLLKIFERHGIIKVKNVLLLKRSFEISHTDGHMVLLKVKTRLGLRHSSL